MGNPISKSYDEAKEKGSESEGSHPTTPILTQKVIKNFDDLDPRSPSLTIVRTPIQTILSNSSERNILTPDVLATPTTTKILGIDPRSPTSEFIRTPIVIQEVDHDGKPTTLKLHNKNLDNVRKSIAQCSPISKGDSKVAIEGVKATIPPKLLQSNPIIAKINENKRKSYIGLLETNLDYIETDIDSAFKNKNTPKKEERETLNLSISELKERFLNAPVPSTPVLNVCENINVGPRSPSLEFLQSPIQITKKTGALVINEPEEVIVSSEEEDSPTVDIVDKPEKQIEIKVDDVIEHVDRPVEETLEDMTCSSEKDSTEAPAQLEDIEVTPRKKVESVKKNVKEFDKKLSSLIYEDDNTEKTVRKAIFKDSNNRTPLGTRNSNGAMKKSISKLKVSDRPTKSLGSSKIPVFQNKIVKGKISSCENTPPRSMMAFKSDSIKKTHWDADKTLVI